MHWQLIVHPLNRLSQLDMRGNPDSCGVWAPCLSYRDGLYYLVFTNVRRFAGDFKDTHNYYVTATDIMGPWSEPVYLNSAGFDPSFFHDDDGRSYYVCMEWQHLPTTGRNNWLPHKHFGGIVCQEVDLIKRQLLGKARPIFAGSDIGLAEGPHLYKRGKWYYLIVAEGGTGRDHAATFARSESLFGPYKADPEGPLLTSSFAPKTALKRAGHGDWVESATGESYLVHLCSRPLPFRGRSVMGRETAAQNLTWNKDGWPRLAHGEQHPRETLNSHHPPLSPRRPTKQRLAFDGKPLPPDYQTLRFPLDNSIANQIEHPGYLRLYGRESLGSWFEQALIARRQQAFHYSATTQLAFTPTSTKHMAGLVCYYNSKKYYYLHVTVDEKGHRILDVSMCCNDWHSQYPMAEPIILLSDGEIKLQATVMDDALTFRYAYPGEPWVIVPLTLDYSVLSDEVGDGGFDANFTGAFVGICCQDLDSQKVYADFSYFEYEEHQTPPLTS